MNFAKNKQIIQKEIGFSKTVLFKIDSQVT